MESPASMIPKKIHFIWVGGLIPIRYITNIYHWASLNPDYEVNLWIDRGSVHPEEMPALEDQLKQISAQIRDLDTTDRGLLNKMLNKDFYEEEVTGVEANYAAASDILRLAILEQEGGVYIDTDTLPIDSKPLGDIDAPYGFVKPLGATNDVLAAIPGSQFVKAFSQRIHTNYCKQLKQSSSATNESMRLHRGIRPWKMRCETTLDWTGPEAILPVLQEQAFTPLIQQGHLEEAKQMAAQIFNQSFGACFNTQSDKTWLDKGPQTLQEEQVYFKEEFRFRLRYFCIEQIKQFHLNNNGIVASYLQQQLTHSPEILDTSHILRQWKTSHHIKCHDIDRLIKYTEKCEKLLQSMPMLGREALINIKTALFPRERFDENKELKKALHPQHVNIKSVYQQFQTMIPQTRRHISWFGRHKVTPEQLYPHETFSQDRTLFGMLY